MLELSRKEIEAGLWCIHTVSAAFSAEPPDGSVLDGLKLKLQAEAQAAPAKPGDIAGDFEPSDGKGMTFLPTNIRGDITLDGMPMPDGPDPGKPIEKYR